MATPMSISYGILIVVVIILLFEMYYLHQRDKHYKKMSKSLVKSLDAHTVNDKYDIMDISHKMLLAKQYQKSSKQKLLNAIRDGAVRGALVGAVTGTGPVGIASGALVWSTVNGVIVGAKILETDIINPNDVDTISELNEPFSISKCFKK
jgi:hypothetical protein